MAEEKKTKKAAEMPEKISAEPSAAEEPKIRRGYILHKNVISDRKHHPVIVNGKVWQVQAGVPIDLPEAVAQVLDNAILAKTYAEDAVERAQKRAQEN